MITIDKPNIRKIINQNISVDNNNENIISNNISSVNLFEDRNLSKKKILVKYDDNDFNILYNNGSNSENDDTLSLIEKRKSKKKGK